MPAADLFLEAIEMLLEGELARRLDSTLRVRKIVDNPILIYSSLSTQKLQHAYNSLYGNS